MAVTNLEQLTSLLGEESLTNLGEINLGETGLDQPQGGQSQTGTLSEQSLNRNLFVESLNTGETGVTGGGQPSPTITKKPKNVSAGNPAYNKPSFAGYQNMNDFWAGTESQMRTNPLYETGYGSSKMTSTKTLRKYDDQDYGYIYGIDNDDFYGKREAWYETAGKIVPRLGMGIINKIGQATGFIAGLVNPWNWGEAIYNTATDQPGGNLIDIASDNAMYKVFTELDEWTRNEWLPTFQEAADKNKGFWARVATDGDFWADDMVDGIAFLASAWIPGAVVARLGVGAAMATRLSALGRTGAVAAETSALAAEAASTARWFEQTGRLARNLDAFNSWALATASESMFEAADVRRTILESPMYNEFGDPVINKKTGKPFTLDERKEAAAQAALNTFGMNAAVLGISNVFEYKFLKKLMGAPTPASGAAGRVIAPAVFGEEAGVKAASPLWKTIATQLPAGVVREGFYEENMQLAIQRYNTNYGLEGTVGNLLNLNTWLPVAKQYSKQTVDALLGNDKEAATNIGLGGLIGSLFGTYTTRRQENKEQDVATQLAAGISEAQNSFIKTGNVFKTQIVDDVDEKGNPIKRQAIVFDENGKPVYDYDKIFALSGMMLTNANELDDSIKEIGKYEQNLLKTRAWAGVVNAYINAGLESKLGAKLDMLEKTDPESLAKLGFSKDENFDKELQKYRRITEKLIKQNEAITNNVLFKNTTFSKKTNVAENNRRAHLVEIGGRQVVYEEIANEVKTDLDALRSKLISDASTSLSDGLVDQLNDLQYRIKSQEQTIEQIKKSGRDKVLPMQVYTNVLNSLKEKYEKLVKDNELSLKSLKKSEKGYYQYEKDSRNDPMANIQLRIKSQNIGALQNEIDNDQQIFNLFANPITGRDDYSKFFNALVSEKQKVAQEQAENERKKKAEDEAKAAFRKETEHKVVPEADGTFSVVSPDGSVLIENLPSEQEALQKAAELTASLVAKKQAEQKTKEEEEKKKQQQQQKKTTPPPGKKKDDQPQVNINDLKTQLKAKEEEAEELMVKGVQESNDERKRMIEEDGLSEEEAQAMTEAIWLGTPDGKKYTQLQNEIEQLKVLIAGAENESNIPTLQEYLEQFYDFYSESPDFKVTYDQWYLSGGANLHINDYNKTYNKNEPLQGKKGTSSDRQSSAQEELDNLDLKDATYKMLSAVTRTISKIYQKIRGNEDLLNKLRDKISEIQDGVLRGALTKLLEGKATTSEFVPLSSVGINLPVEEHFVYDRINMTAEEAQLGFTLLGDDTILEDLSGKTGDLTDLVKAVATIAYVNKAQEMLDQAGIPNRSLITYETPKDIANLNKGISIIAKYRPNDGFNLQLFLKDGSTRNIYVGGINRYAIVHPDNTTEKVEWTEEQREFVINNMLIDGKKMTNEQYDKFAEMYRKMQVFEEKVMSFLNENLENSADKESLDITALFKDTFTLSNSGGFFTEKGESFDSVIAKAASADKLFTVSVMDENDVVQEKQVPLFARFEKTRWTFEFLLNDGEQLVKIDESGEIAPVTNVQEYLKEQFGINLEMTSAFPGGYAWIAKDSNERGYKPYKLARTKGTETPELFKEFVRSFKALKQSIADGLASDDGIYRFEGKEYPNIPSLMMAFNIEHYGFYQNNGYVLNISYNKNAKSYGKVVGKFLFEIRPLDKAQRKLVDDNKDIKKALNMYMSDDVLMKVTDDLSDEKTTELYKEFVKNLMTDFSKKREALKKSDNPYLKKVASELDEHLMFSYDLRNNVKTFKLQLIKKSEDYRSIPFFSFDAKSIKVKNSLQLTFNDNAPIAPKPTSTAGTFTPTTPYGTQTGPELTTDTSTTGGRVIEDEINPDDDSDGAFMLAETEENYQRYTQELFDKEVAWLRSALPADIKLEDLGKILNNLITKKQVLGYYKDKAIYVDEKMSAIGSIYHEAFHALFRDLFTQRERNFYLSKIKTKVGYITNKEVEQFRTEREYFNKSDEEIRDLIYEEHLAEGFRKWKLEKKEPKESWFKQFVKKLGRILDFFKSNKDEIEQLYEDFDAGRYSSRDVQASTISKEGVYSIAYGRPQLKVKEGAVNFTQDNTVPLNIGLQNELVYKILNKMGSRTDGTFTERFTKAIEEVKEDYNIEKLIRNSDNPKEMADAIRARYSNYFDDALFVLGESVPFALSDDLINADDAKSYRTTPGSNVKTLEVIRKEVENKLETLGLDKGFDIDNLEIPESEEDRVESEKGGEFDTIHMNPLHGLSKEFRSLFSTIPYEYKDEQLGVTINKVADGKMLFEAMIKIAANTPIQNILPSLAKAIDSLKEDNDRTSVQLEAFANFIKNTFGITDLSDPEAKPSKNIFLYRQFIDTFFVTELPSYQIKLSTFKDVSRSEIFDASINQDVIDKKEKIKFFFESAYRRLNTEEQKSKFQEDFSDLQGYIKDTVIPGVSNRLVINSRSKELAKVVNTLKKKLDAVNIILPKSLLRQSLIAIYNIENQMEFSPQSKQNRIDMEIDQHLMKEGAYLQKDFFINLSSLSPENFSNVFADTKDVTLNFGKDRTRIEQINAIAKKAMKYVIKYDVNSAIPVYQNAEGKKIWRYSKYTPPILLAQMVREYGIESIIDEYPLLKEWYSDNPLFSDDLQNELFLKNFVISSNGGFRQELDDSAKEGSTFGNIDTRSLMITNIVHFMNRQTIKETMKDTKGKNTSVEVTTYLRGRTQEEATTSNFLVTSKYQKLVTKDGQVSEVMIDNLVKMIRQEYNRIQREWETRGDETKVRYENYNNRINPDTDQVIEGDSYVTKDGKTVKLRAYQFKNFEHFFELQKTTPVNEVLRETLKETLRDAAKAGVSFEDAMASQMPEANPGLVISEFLRDQLTDYMDETFQVYKKALLDNLVIEKNIENNVETLTSDFIPNTIELDYKPAQTIEEFGYAGIEDLLKDQHFNTFLNKLLANQIFDGDIATGLANATAYYKRNKSGVISGNSMKSDNYLRTATIQNLQADINYDDLTQYAKEITNDTPGKNKTDIADGQSWHVLNHRIRMMDTWGRLDPRSRQLLNEYKFRELTVDEINELKDKKIVLNSIKSATGGVFEYFKLSEHLISRVDVSYLVPKTDETIEEAYTNLAMLYSEIERIEDRVIRNPYAPETAELEEEIKALYEEVHQYWKPKKTRAKLHHLLNSMELSGIDQVFDTNASKKTTVVPIKLNDIGITELKPAKQITNGMFKFLQVETSGIHNHIKLPTQARQLLTTYINKIDSKAYNNKTIADLAKEYAENLGETTRSKMKLLDSKLLDSKGNLNVVQLYNIMRNGLKKQGADANTLKFLEIKDGQPVFNPNMPVIKKIFTYYYFAMFNDAVFSETVSGRSDILVSSYGYEVLYDSETGRIITEAEQRENRDAYNSDRYKTRPLGVSVEEKNGMKVYTVEVIIPEPLTKNETLKALYLEKLNQFFSTRIPTEDKRSMVVSKVVDYMDAAYQNSIVVPQVVHILAGSDLDVDKLYSHTFAHYIDFNNEAHVYGDYSKFATKSRGRFIEYINYMLNEDMAVKDALIAELENVSEKPVFNADFLKLKDELGLIDINYTPEEIAEKRKEINYIVDILSREAKELQIEANMLFDLHIQNNDRRGSEGRENWKNSLERYRNMKDLLDSKREELENVKEEQKRINQTLKLAALYNVLRRMGLPTTQSGLTKYTSEFGNPVIAVLQNQSLQLKIDILSNEQVFKDWYINEKSDTKPFKDIAKSIGATVEDVVNENSIHSILGDVVANQLNSSNKDGIGIAASFNKFLAFAEKNDLTLEGTLFGTMTTNSVVTEFGTIVEKADISSIDDHSNFQNTNGIKRVGGSLGMFADAAKDPIPSVLNLNPGTSSVTNLLMSMSGNLQLGLLINKLPFIEQITKEVELAKSNAQSINTRRSTNTSQLIKDGVMRDLYDSIAMQDRLHELFKRNEKGELTKEMIPMYIETVEPNEQLSEMIALQEAQKQKGELQEGEKEAPKIKLSDVGFVVRYEDGSLVAEDVSSFYLAKVYTDALFINNDIIRLVRILNLIKEQKPDFTELDMMLADVTYFMSGDSVFGSSIATILSSSAEYVPLIEAAKKMSKYSEQLFIERSPLFKSLNSILQSNFREARNPKQKQAVTDQITKLLIIQKAKIELESQLKDLADKTDENSLKLKTLYENSLKYFTSDYWINENSSLEDLDYLYEKNPGNPFVEFLKTSLYGNVLLLEGSTRIKLDKDIAENINNGFESLQKSNDPKTSILARQLYYYLLVKDGLGYSNNSFLSYLNPELKQFKQTSNHLDEFQDLLKSQKKFIEQKQVELIKIIQNKQLKDDQRKNAIEKVSDEIYKNYLSLFDAYFKNENKGNVDWINIIIKKITANAANQKYIRQYYGTGTKLDNDESVGFVKEMIKLNMFPDLVTDTDEVLKNNKAFNVLEFVGDKKRFDVNFSEIANLKTLINISQTYDVHFGSLFPLSIDKEGKFKGAAFPMIIKSTENRLFKLSAVNGESISKQIGIQSILGGGAIQMLGTTATYTEIDVEGTSRILNFGFTENDGKNLYQHSQVRNTYLSEEDYLFNLGVTYTNTNYQGSDERPPGLPDGYEFNDMPPEGMEYNSDQEELDNLPDWAKQQFGLSEKKIQEPKKPVSDKREYTPQSVGLKELPENGILVFGSNTEGRHGLGAANDAKRLFGAKQGQAKGLQGRSYAIVTKHLPAGKRSVKLESIQKEINDLMIFAKNHPDLKFYVTKIGTNYAGYSIAEMKSLFKEVNTSMAGIPENVILPKEFEVRDDPKQPQKPAETKPTKTKTAEEQELEDLPDWAKEQLGLSKDKKEPPKFDPNNNDLEEGDQPNNCGLG